MNLNEKVYIGDGVYVEFDNWNVTLTTENGVSVTNQIVLEPSVLAQFLHYIERLRSEIRR